MEYVQLAQMDLSLPFQPQETIPTTNYNEIQQKSSRKDEFEYRARMNPIADLGGFCGHHGSNEPSSECDQFFDRNFDISIHMLRFMADLDQQYCPVAFCDVSLDFAKTEESAKAIREHFICVHADVTELEKNVLREFCANGLTLPTQVNNNYQPTQINTGYQPAPQGGFDYEATPTMANAFPFQEAPPQIFHYQALDAGSIAAAANHFAAPQGTFTQAADLAVTDGLDAESLALLDNVLPNNQGQAEPPMAGTQPAPERLLVAGAPHQRGHRASRTIGTGQHECHWDGCPSTFTTEQSRKNHEDSAHYGLRFPCPDCTKIFTDVANVGRHRRAQHMLASKRGGQRVFPCEVCGKEFNRKDNLKRHVGTKTCKKQAQPGMQPEQQE